MIDLSNQKGFNSKSKTLTRSHDSVNVRRKESTKTRLGSKHSSMHRRHQASMEEQGPISCLDQTLLQSGLRRQDDGRQDTRLLPRTTQHHAAKIDRPGIHTERRPEQAPKHCQQEAKTGSLGDVNKLQNKNNSYLRPDHRTDLALCSSDRPATNSNNSSTGNQGYTNIPMCAGLAMPRCCEPDECSTGYLCLRPDQIDMLLALAVSNYTGTDMVGCCKMALQAGEMADIMRNYLVAVKYRLCDVMDRLLRVIRRNFLTIAKTKEFLSLPIEFVMIFMEDSYLNVCNELDMFTVALSWVDYNKQERIQHAGRILKSVRYVHIDPGDIACYVEPNLHLFTGPHGIQALVNLYKHHVYKDCVPVPAGTQCQVPPKRCPSRTPDKTFITTDPYYNGQARQPVQVAGQRAGQGACQRAGQGAGQRAGQGSGQGADQGFDCLRDYRYFPGNYQPQMQGTQQDATQPQMQGTQQDATQPQMQGTQQSAGGPSPQPPGPQADKKAAASKSQANTPTDARQTKGRVSFQSDSINKSTSAATYSHDPMSGSNNTSNANSNRLKQLRSRSGVRAAKLCHQTTKNREVPENPSSCGTISLHRSCSHASLNQPPKGRGDAACVGHNWQSQGTLRPQGVHGSDETFRSQGGFVANGMYGPQGQYWSQGPDEPHGAYGSQRAYGSQQAYGVVRSMLPRDNPIIRCNDTRPTNTTFGTVFNRSSAPGDRQRGRDGGSQSLKTVFHVKWIKAGPDTSATVPRLNCARST